MRTLAGAELVEVVTRKMQLTPEQGVSMAIAILMGPAGKETPPSFSGRQRKSICFRGPGE